MVRATSLKAHTMGSLVGQGSELVQDLGLKSGPRHEDQFQLLPRGGGRASLSSGSPCQEQGGQPSAPSPSEGRVKL